MEHTTTAHHQGKQRTVIDASGTILGRLASYAAKQVLIGNEIVIVNAEKAVISGRKQRIVNDFKQHLGTKTWGSQKKAPKHQRRPDTYVRRVIRGMLPWKKARGRNAFRRLKVYISTPEDLEQAPLTYIHEAQKNLRPAMTVGELLTIFGWINPMEET
jgi:large subunit ribosomal protein L13